MSKVARYNTKDRISRLPDNILSRILSKLDLNSVMRTSVLSRDWEFKWTLIDNVDTESDYFPNQINDIAFLNLVDKILLHLQNIRSFSLSCLFAYSGQDLSRISAMISSIMRHNIESLNLAIYEGDLEELVLPRSFLNCTSLTNLSLFMSCTFSVPVVNCYANLKKLFLNQVKILNASSVSDTLIFDFPVLELLSLIECRWLKVKFVEMHAPSLAEFISVTPKDDYFDAEDFSYHMIKVVGAKLDTLSLSGRYNENIMLSNSKVASASLSYYYPHFLSTDGRGLHIRKLLRELSTVKKLRMYSFFQGIGGSRQGLPLPRFQELEELYLVCGIDDVGLLEVLYAAPYLKILKSLVTSSDNFDYDSSNPTPSCVLDHLEEVSIRYTPSSVSTFEAVKFLLKNGLKLKTLELHYVHDSMFEDEVVDLLSTIPKGSACVTTVNRSGR